MTAFRTELLLARTFFRRLFESDLMPPGLPQVQLVIWGVAALTAPGYLLSWYLSIQYSNLSRVTAARRADVILLDQLVFVTFAMVALGGLALLVWEGVFPDRRDARILGTLPLRTRAHVLGRLGALAAVAALFCVGVNLPSAVVYGSLVWAHGAAGNLGRGVAAHLAATAAAGLFAFFLVIAAQGILLNISGRRVAQRLALLFQSIFVVVLLQTLLFIPYLRSIVGAAFRGDETSIAGFLPPAWFLALDNLLAGAPRPAPSGYALAAVGATSGVMILATVLLAASYQRLTRRAIETLDGGGQARRRLVGRASSAVARHVTPDPVQRAVAAFTLRTITRSRSHLMLLATYMGVAAALILSTLMPLIASDGIAAVTAPSVALLSAPLVLYFFTLGGLRALFAIPASINANWAFRLHLAESHLVVAIEGVRAALVTAVVVPIALASALAAAALWGVRTGALHGLFTGALGVLLVDVLLIGLRKIPFTCTYYPGRSRVRTLWPFYAIAFSLYAYSFAGLEAAILHRPDFVAAFVAVAAGVVAALTFVRRRDLRPPPGFTYEEEDPDRIFAGFGLSEGLAAQSVPPRPSPGKTG